MTSRFLLAATSLVAPLAVARADDLADLLNRVPADMNTVAVINVREINKTPRAVKEKWRDNAETEYLAGAIAVPPWVPVVVIGADLHPGSGGDRSVALIPVAASVNSAAIAKRENGVVQTVDDLTLVQETSTGPQNVAFWHMNDTTGPMLDSGLAPANNGTLSGTIARNGTSYTFTRGWVTVPTEASLNPGTANVTIAANVSPTSLPTTGDFDVLRKGDAPNQLYKVEILQSGALFCQFHGSGHTVGATSTTLIAPNTGFHTIQCVKTTSQVQAIVDGNITSKSGNVGAISNSAPVVIGAHTGGNNDFFKGGIDQVSLTFG